MDKPRTRRASKYKKSDVENQTRIFNLTPLNDNQRLYINALETSPQVIVTGFSGTGKTFIAATYAANMYAAKQIDRIILTRPNVSVGKDLGYFPGPQPLWSKVLTPTGWTEIGKLSVGDKVIGSHGKPVTVTGVYPQGVKTVYEIFTSDGRVACSSDDHLWYTTTWEQNKRKKPGSVKPLSEIMKSLKTEKGKLNHYLPTVPAVEFETSEHLPIPPYTLGCLIGDGSFGETITLANKEEDFEIRNRCAKEVYQSFGLKMKSNGMLHYFSGNYPSNKKTKLDKSLTGRWTNPLKQAVDSLGLLKVHGPLKFIPPSYMFSSVEDRLNLLRGLMDTDGSVKKAGEAVFHTSSQELAENVQELVWSLGGNAVIKNRGKREASLYLGRAIEANHPSFDVRVSLLDYNPFYLSRKASRYKQSYLHTPKIKSVELLGEQECVCISVESDDHLYVTSSYILTHNTLNEKFAPWVAPVIDVLNEQLGKGVVETGIKNGNIEMAPLATMRGRSFHDAFIMLDESQNVSIPEIKMFLTRIGKGCKVVINGDIRQSDLNQQSGLSKILHMVKKYHMDVPVIEFGIDDIVRSDLVKEWVVNFDKEGL